jgi:hypothetical protein
VRAPFVWLIAVLVAGCFTPDLGDGQVLCGAGGACPPSYVCRADGRCYHDAGDGGATDLAGGGTSGDLATHCDRPCPPTSSCAGGICAPPVGAAACMRTSDCAGGAVCNEFNMNGMLHGFCTPPIGGGGSAAHCDGAGYDLTCATGICVADDKSRLACLFPCKGDGDCPSGKCQSTVTQPRMIEGAPTGGLRFCSN